MTPGLGALGRQMVLRLTLVRQVARGQGRSQLVRDRRVQRVGMGRRLGALGRVLR